MKVCVLLNKIEPESSFPKINLSRDLAQFQLHLQRIFKVEKNVWIN